MRKLSDNDIDQLFKQAAEQQQPKFDVADWHNLADRLDKQSQPRPGYYYTWIGAGIVLGLLIWTGLTVGDTSQTMNSISSVTKSTERDEHVKVVEPPKESVTISSSEKGTDSSNSFIGSSSTEKVNPSGPASDEAVSSSRRIEVRRKSRSINRNVAAAESVATARVGSQVATPSTVNEGSDSTVADKFSTGSENQIEAIDSEKNNGSKISLAPSAVVSGFEKKSPSTSGVRENHEGVSATKQTQPSGTGKLDVVKEENTDSVEVVSEAERKEKNVTSPDETDSEEEKKNAFYRLGVRATASPDFSAEQFGNVGKAGVNYGVMVEYFMFRNISVSTGAIWSRKFYTAENVEYSNLQANYVEGDCRMWDIPLNLNYYFNPEKSLSFFASAGLTSYLMNEENYTFEVETGYGTRTYSQQVIKENNEWFKTLNLSVGLQKQVSSRFAIQIEPFVKVPLAGVGAGNISLSSFGSFLSLRYNFLTSQK